MTLLIQFENWKRCVQTMKIPCDNQGSFLFPLRALTRRSARSQSARHTWPTCRWCSLITPGGRNKVLSINANQCLVSKACSCSGNILNVSPRQFYEPSFGWQLNSHPPLINCKLFITEILTLISLNTKHPHVAPTSPYPYREETKQQTIRG